MFHLAEATPVLHETLGIPAPVHAPSSAPADVARSVAIRVLLSFAVIAISVSIGASLA
jgi:hypothetical protein